MKITKVNLLKNQRFYFQQDSTSVHNFHFSHDLFDDRFFLLALSVCILDHLTPTEIFLCYSKDIKDLNSLEDLQLSITNAINNIDGKIITRATRSKNVWTKRVIFLGIQSVENCGISDITRVMSKENLSISFIHPKGPTITKLAIVKTLYNYKSKSIPYLNMSCLEPKNFNDNQIVKNPVDK